MFGQSLDQHVLGHAFRLAESARTFVAIGSSLQVQPAASLVEVAASAGAYVVIVNADPTPYDDLAAEIVRGPIEDAVPDFVRRLSARP